MKKIFAILTLSLLISCGLEPDTKEGNRLIVSDNAYYINYENTVLKLDDNLYLTKETKMEDYFVGFLGTHLKNEQKLLVDLSKYFPHSISSIVEGEDIKDAILMPTVEIDGKKIVDNIALSDILLENTLDSLIKVDDISEIITVKDTTQVSPEISLEGKNIVILNGNGINGFASNLGKEIKKNLKMNYVAENFNEKTDFSYIINHRLTDEQFDKLVNSLSLKYIKIKKDKNVRPEADVVLITGNDNKVTYTLNIVSPTGKSEIKELLDGYNSVEIKNENEKTKDIIIKYRSEDELIAKKLLSYLPEAKLILDDKLQGNVTIISPR